MASHVVRLENWLYLKNEQMEWTDFLHVDTDSQKFKTAQKCIGWAWSKMGVVIQVTVV